MSKRDIIGKEFGKLKVIKRHSTTRNGHIRYTCICDCGRTKNVLATHLRQGNSKTCGACSVPKGDKHASWTGVGDMSGDFWYNHVVRSANGDKRRSIPLTLTKEEAWDLFLKQDKKCALTGLELHFPEKNHMPYTASLDRIDSSKGYTISNVQWVHKDINMMKRIYDQDYFIEMCTLVAKRSM